MRGVVRGSVQRLNCLLLDWSKTVCKSVSVTLHDKTSDPAYRAIAKILHFGVAGIVPYRLGKYSAMPSDAEVQIGMKSLKCIKARGHTVIEVIHVGG